MVADDPLTDRDDTSVNLKDIKGTERRDFIPGCRLGQNEGWAVLMCDRPSILLKFHCRDHTGRDHALSALLGARDWDIYCQ